MNAEPVVNMNLRAALRYQRAGLFPMPMRPDDSKAPPAWLTGWESLDDIDLERAFRDPDMNLSLRMGPQPATGINIYCLDVDPKNGGFETLAAWAKLYGPLPFTAIHSTPSGGSHHFFDAPADLRTVNRKVGAGLDTRGFKGYVGAPPSRLSYGAYETSKATSILYAERAPLPDYVLDMLAPKVSESVARHPASAPLGGDKPGDWVRAHLDFSTYLLKHGWTHVGGEKWRHPSATNDHSAMLKNEGRGPLNVFSSNLPESLLALDVSRSGDCHVFTLFDFIAGYEFGGDRSACASWVRRNYMGAADHRSGARPVVGSTSEDGQAHDVVSDTVALNLPAGFWSQRPVLAHIHQAARSGRCSPDALLVQALARTATFIHPCFKLPGVEQGLIGKHQTLDFLGCVVAETSGGKSMAAGVGELLIPAPEPPSNGDDPVIDFEQQVGSGEGIAEFFLVPELRPDDESGKLKPTGRRVVGKQALFMNVDEGTGFVNQAGRKGATIVSTLASVWSGQSMGQLNAGAETRRLVQGGRVRVCTVISMQDSNAHKLYTDDLESVGFTGRLLFASAHDPSAVDVGKVVWPGPLKWSIRAGNSTTNVYYTYSDSIVDEIIATRDGILNKTVAIDRKQSQYLLLRCKVAAILATWEGRLAVTDDDWALATEVIGMSSTVLMALDRAHYVQGEVTAVTAATFRLTVAQKAQSAHVNSLAVGWQSKALARLRKEGPLSFKVLKYMVDAPYRKELRRVLDEMVSAGILTHDGARYAARS